MAGDKFEIRPQGPIEPPPTVPVPDFAAMMKLESTSAMLWEETRGLMSRGVLPEVQMALHDKGHKPNDHVHKQVLGLGDVDLVYDDKGDLASAHLDMGHGNSEDAQFRDGHITNDRLNGNYTASYNFDSDGHITSGSATTIAGSSHYYELGANGTVTHSVDIDSIRGDKEYQNTPGHHTYRAIDPDGTTGTLTYDDQLHFQSGQIRTPDGSLFGIRIGPQGKPIMVPEREA
jgi:hypothetical protein